MKEQQTMTGTWWHGSEYRMSYIEDFMWKATPEELQLLMNFCDELENKRQRAT